MIKYKGLPISDTTFFLLGFSSTASVLALIIGGHVLSLFSITLVLSFFILLKDKRVITHNHKEGNCFLIWTFISILSIIFGQIYFINMSKWQEASLSYLPKIIIYLVFYYLLIGSANSYKFSHLIMQGIKIGIIVNLIWGIIDAIFFYSLGYSITNTIFQSYINAMGIRDGALAIIENSSVFRTGGLNGDPSNIGLFAIVLSFYAFFKRKYMYLILCFFSMLASISFIALLGIALSFLFYVILFRDKKIIKMGIGVSLLFLLLFYYLYNSDNQITQAAKAAFEYKLEKKSETDVSDVRVLFISNFIPAILQTPSSLLIGTGYMTSSYAYRDGLLPRETLPYDMENHYVSTFFDVGLLGFVFFLLMYYTIIKELLKYKRKRDSDHYILLLSCILGSIIAFMSYHFTMYSVNNIVCFCAMSYLIHNRNSSVDEKYE